MIINIIYILVSLIFLFLIYLIIKSIIRGLVGKNKNKNNLKK
jgi:TM2 domain-containing membrane protein YozV